MHVLLHPVGSHGDVHPFVAAGVALKARGHGVTLITAEPFRPLADAHGFAFAPTHTAEDFAAVLHDPEVWHPTRSLRALLGGERAERALRAAYRAIESHYRPGETVLLAGSLGIAARLAREKLGVPLATVHLQPMALGSAADPPVYAGLTVKRWWPHWFRRAVYWYGNRRLVDPIIAPPVNRLRVELGLKPMTGVFGPWRHSPDRLLLFFPKWFADAPDYPPQSRHVGFVRYDQADTHPTPPRVRAFLAANPPPAVVSLGSAMHQAGPTLKLFVEALKVTGGRGLILARDGPQVPPELPPTVLQADYAPFSEVFPLAAVAVHHGGIGTSAQALAAGVPQLVLPMAFDQYDNAARLERLGVARSLRPDALTAEALAGAIAELAGSDAVRAACAANAGRLRGEPAVPAGLVAMVEEMRNRSGFGASRERERPE